MRLSIPGYWLTEQEYQELQKELAALENKYIQVSVANRKSKNLTAFRVSSLVTMLPKWHPLIFNDIKKNFE